MASRVEGQPSSGLPDGETKGSYRGSSLKAKPLITPKPFSLQRNTTLRSINAPKTAVPSSPSSPPSSRFSMKNLFPGAAKADPTAVLQTSPAIADAKPKRESPVLKVKREEGSASRPSDTPPLGESALPTPRPIERKTSPVSIPAEAPPTITKDDKTAPLSVPVKEHVMISQEITVKDKKKVSDTTLAAATSDPTEPKTLPVVDQPAPRDTTPPDTIPKSAVTLRRPKASTGVLELKDEANAKTPLSPTSQDPPSKRSMARNRLSMELTMKFESGSQPLPSLTPQTARGKYVGKLPTSTLEPEKVNPTVVQPSGEKDAEVVKVEAEEDRTGGSSIKRRITLLFDSSSRPEVTTKREEPPVVTQSNETGAAVKDRIKNWAVETNAETDNIVQPQTKTPTKDFDTIDLAKEENTPTEMSSEETSDLLPAVSSAAKPLDDPVETPQSTSPDEETPESSTDKSLEPAQDGSADSAAVLSDPSSMEAHRANPLKDRTLRRSVRFGTVERDDGKPPVLLGSEPDSSTEEEDLSEDEGHDGPIEEAIKIEKEKEREKHEEFMCQKQREEQKEKVTRMEERLRENETFKEAERQKQRQREEEEEAQRERLKQKERELEEDRERVRRDEERLREQMRKKEKQIEEERLRKEEKERESQREEERERQEKEQRLRAEERERERQREEERAKQRAEERLQAKERERERQREEERLKEEEREKKRVEERLQAEERERERQKEENRERQRVEERERQKEEERERQRVEERLRAEETERERKREEERLKEEEREKQRDRERLKEETKERQALEERLKVEERERARLEERLREEAKERQRVEERLREEAKERLRLEERLREQERERQKMEERLRGEEEELERERQVELTQQRKRDEDRERARQTEERLREEERVREEARRREVEETERSERQLRAEQIEREAERILAVKRERDRMISEVEERERERQKQQRLREERERERRTQEALDRKSAEELEAKLRETERRREEEEGERRREREREKERERERLQEEQERIKKRQEEEERAQERKEEAARRKQAEEEEEVTRQQAVRDRERPAVDTDILISFDSEDVGQKAELRSAVPTALLVEPTLKAEGPLEVPFDDFSVKKPVIDVLFDDFSVTPRRWGSKPRVPQTPEPDSGLEDVWVRRAPDVDSRTLQAQESDVVPRPLIPCLVPRPREEPRGPYNIPAVEQEEAEVVEEDEDEMVHEEKKEEREGGVAELKEKWNSFSADGDGLDNEAVVDNEPEEQYEDYEHNDISESEAESPTPALEPYPDVHMDDWDGVEPRTEPGLPAFPESSSPLLDNKALRSRAELRKRMSQRTRLPRTRLSSPGVFLNEDSTSTPDWRASDNTEETAESNEDEKEKRSVKGPPTSQRSPVFPGLESSHSALVAQLKKKTGGGGGGGGVQTTPVKDKAAAAREDLAALARSPSMRSPRPAALLPGAARVLPPIGGKDDGTGSSPSWMQELKKKRMSQQESGS